MFSGTITQVPTLSGAASQAMATSPTAVSTDAAARVRVILGPDDSVPDEKATGGARVRVLQPGVPGVRWRPARPL